ncbi:SDR family oxidoreductase [Pseudidiomarina marina]|uniref:UDP-glucose 4-epimerase family protein n=1 Tax=Pseudidiomarina marina TaxID=502366 RepID=UPI00384E50C6
MYKKVVAVTGATGFVGEHVSNRLMTENYSVISIGRRKPVLTSDVNNVHFDLHQPAIDKMSLHGVDTFIHCAARAHVMDEDQNEARELYLTTNTEATVKLANEAADAGVKRFIYISSIKAIGEKTNNGEPLRFDSDYNYEDAYGESKALAEKALKEITENTSMEVVIIRPPLVYGPGVKANFAAMMKLAKRNLPLPLASVKNKRSLVAIDNLVDLIVTCIEHPKAANQTLMVSDDRDVSTPELLSAMTQAHGLQPRLWPFPVNLLQMAATLVGKRNLADRLFSSLQVDIEHTKNILGWRPKVTMEEQLKKCVEEDVT